MKLSCNGCRVLRKGCSENCTIKPCLEWISSREAQGHATLFLAKFYGRTGLLNLLANATNQNSQVVFKSLLYEAAGRLVNPTDGALGLFWTGQWSRCEAAVESILTGSIIKDATVIDGQTSSDTLVAENHVLPTTSDIRHVARGTNVDIKEKAQFKRVGSIFKPKPRVGLADNATLVKSILENGSVKIVEASSMIEKKLKEVVDRQTSSDTLIGENHVLPTTSDIRHVARGANVDIQEKTQFKRAESIFKPKPRVGLSDNATLLKSILENGGVKIVEASSMMEKELNGAADGQTSSDTLIAENHVLPTTSDIRHVARDTNVVIKEKSQFKRAGSIFKPKPRVGWADNATLLKSILENSGVKTVEASSMIEKELNRAAETQVNLKLTLGFNCQSSNGKTKYDN